MSDILTSHNLKQANILTKFNTDIIIEILSYGSLPSNYIESVFRLNYYTHYFFLYSREVLNLLMCSKKFYSYFNNILKKQQNFKKVKKFMNPMMYYLKSNFEYVKYMIFKDLYTKRTKDCYVITPRRFINFNFVVNDISDIEKKYFYLYKDLYKKCNKKDCRRLVNKNTGFCLECCLNIIDDIHVKNPCLKNRTNCKYVHEYKRYGEYCCKQCQDKPYEFYEPIFVNI